MRGNDVIQCFMMKTCWLNVYCTALANNGLVATSRSVYSTDIRFFQRHTKRCDAYAHEMGYPGWDPRGLASTSKTPRGQNFVALALASTMRGIGFGFEEIWP